MMILTTTLCLLSWILVIYNTNPETTGFLAIIFFYTSLWLFIVGAFALLGLLVRAITNQKELMFRKVLVSFRQGVWLASLIIISLFLFQRGQLTLRNAAFTIGILTILEFMFLIKK
jgi:hypothetical protein